MPRSFLAMLLGGVLVAAAFTLGVAWLAGLPRPGAGEWAGGAALLVLVLLILRVLAGRGKAG
ncbi:MAG: hypothetical protein CVT80_04065 [Alphaproteobacteria bacterium HGW-Alphaproteobacteria-2]|nr:MAG: hypothetical protein CVT80_04065 [Alphaproteobacteria bacterium HGW-Alphaproteobacteria-2]